MAEFKREQLDGFLGIVRKYMQVRGNLTQKQLAEMAGIGDSTMSRFMNQKTSELNADIISRLVAFLSIPLHEIIDFVDEGFTEEFKRYVNFHKEGRQQGAGGEGTGPLNEAGGNLGRRKDDQPGAAPGTAQRPATAQVQARPGVTRSIPFGNEPDRIGDMKALWETFEGLSSKQKLYLKDFFNLDLEGKDLIVDVGSNIIRFIRQKGLETP